MCKVLNTTAIASGYAGRDPQGGTSDGSLFCKFSFMLPLMIKILFQFLKRKQKNRVTTKFGRKWQIEKVGKWKMYIYKEIKKID